MSNNFFKIIFRFLYRNKTFSILNFLGLTFGLVCSIIALLYIQTVVNHDKNHKNYDRLYSLEAYVTYFNGDRFLKEYLSASLADIIKTEAPEIENITRVRNYSSTFLMNEGSFNETGIYADNNFFELFTFPLENGTAKGILNENNSIVISHDMAVKFFNTTDCIGETIVVKENGKQDAFNVKGVLGKVRGTSVFDFDFIIPFSHFLTENTWANETGAAANNTWVLLSNSAEKEIVSRKVKNLIINQETTLNQELFLFPLGEKILYDYSDGRRVWGELQNLVLAGVIAFAILLIACFNFINLAIAMNMKRYSEAGIKKISGAGRSAIILQYLGESLIITIISFLFALLFVFLLLPEFNMIFNAEADFSLTGISTILFFLAITLFTGIISGIMPALYMASANPLNVLKGGISTNRSFSIFRQALIVFQFTIPIALIIFMLILNRQDSFIKNYDVGIDKDNVIILNNSTYISQHFETMKAELLSIPGVETVNFTNCVPTHGALVSNEVGWDGKDDSEKLHFWCINTDYDYDKIVKIKITDGRFFNRSFSADSDNYVINDIAAGLLKNNDPVGSEISVEGRKGSIIGVFSDFHTIDLSGPMVPTIIRINPGGASTLLVKCSSGQYLNASESIKDMFKKYDPESVYQLRSFREFTENPSLRLSSGFVGLASVVAIILACLGMLGLTAFTAESRTKEIGVRKVNGATVWSIFRLLLTGYTKWITIAFLVSLPVAFVWGRFFLGRFYFHTSMPVWAFFVGPLIAYSVALLTVSWQSWKAATRNPVEALRYE